MSAYRPNTTQTPDIIFDRWMAILNGSELKVLLYIVRRTYGFGKEGDAISINQIVSGIKRRTRSGEECDWGTGLDRDTVMAALSALESIGLLTRKPCIRANGGSDATYHTVNLDAPVPERTKYKTLLRDIRSCNRRSSRTQSETAETCAETAETIAVGESEIPTGGLAEKSDRGGGRKIRLPVAENSDSPLAEKSDGGMVGPLAENSDPQQTETYRETTNSNAEDREAENALPEQTLSPLLDAVAAVSIETPEPEGETETLPISETERIPDGESEDPRLALVGRLVAVGVTQEIAEQLVKRYPQQCVLQLRYLPHASIRSTPAAYLVAAIKGAYAAPHGFVEAQRERQANNDAEAAHRRVPIVSKLGGGVTTTPQSAAVSTDQEKAERIELLLGEARKDPARWAELYAHAETQLHQALRRPGSTGKAYVAIVEGKMRELLGAELETK